MGDFRQLASVVIHNDASAMGVLAFGLELLTVTGLVQLWHVYVFAFLSGCAAAFDAPVRQTFVAELVGDAINRHGAWGERTTSGLACASRLVVHITVSMKSVAMTTDDGNDCVERIHRCLSALTSAQQSLAAWVLGNGDDVAFMTAKQLAEATGQSDAAVVRFARAIGYTGYSAMREALRHGLLERAGSSGMRDRKMPVGSEALKQDVLTSSQDLITETERLNQAATMSAVADRLITARRICVSGHGTSFPLAGYLALQLNQLLDRAEVFNVANGDLADRFRSIGPADVFIGIGYVRYIPYTVDILRVAREAGAHIVAVTDLITSPLARLADQVLWAARATAATAWWSQAGTLALADWLCAAVMTRDPSTINQLRRSDDAWRRVGHWRGENNRQHPKSPSTPVANT